MFSDVSLDRAQLVLRKAPSLRPSDRLEPELRNSGLALNVHVRRLAPVAAGKEEPVLPDVPDAGHAPIISHMRTNRSKYLALWHL